VAADPAQLERLRGWPLPYDAGADYRDDPAGFIGAYCAAEAGRARLVGATLDEMMTRRDRLAPALRLIGNWTAAFGA
jgi:hypothetical protein